MLERQRQSFVALSVVDLVNDILVKALERNASDIHLESHHTGARVRYRIDGTLYDQQPVELIHAAQVISRIKILAHNNIAEKRVPQDGKFQMKWTHKTVDLRVSTFPSIYGEKIVIRILDRTNLSISLEKLGFQPAVFERYCHLMQRSQGFFLVTGPTGSGKTTTLYATLFALHSSEKNIITLEDPVEYNIDGITQGQIHPEAGFTFERGIRALLRQDPDIAMIGEIRDKQTARIAIEASLTGHLVLSTLHTNDAASTVMRLMDMAIEPFLINTSLTGVLAQRLVRKICTNCRIEIEPTDQHNKLLERLNVSMKKIFKGVGCADCFNLGYKGRIGIFELLVVTNSLRALIVSNPHFDAIQQQALADGMSPLIVDAREKLQTGVVSLEEVARVLC
jgi:type II secretory ATPase GspE/PulE/Tfp pilus assembly ATPase PilB-like protein